jgi:hypothetical protein
MAESAVVTTGTFVEDGSAKISRHRKGNTGDATGSACGLLGDVASEGLLASGVGSTWRGKQVES